MTADEKLAAILAAMQTDPGSRGLGRVPGDNLFTACPADFAAACRLLTETAAPRLAVVTGFYVPTADPPAFETDGPLGAVFLARGLLPHGIRVGLFAEPACSAAMAKGLAAAGIDPGYAGELVRSRVDGTTGFYGGLADCTHYLALERVGPAADGRCYSMRGRDLTDTMLPVADLFAAVPAPFTIGVGDGGNEIGMGKVRHETVAANIPDGDRIHCRVPTDHLIVAGVSNWGAYALAAGVSVVRGVPPPRDLFDPHWERYVLDVMVREGPLVDGVTGKQTPTVDGLTWDEYVKPLVRIREILES